MSRKVKLIPTPRIERKETGPDTLTAGFLLLFGLFVLLLALTAMGFGK